jgi:hypothetical protein
VVSAVGTTRVAGTDTGARRGIHTDAMISSHPNKMTMADASFFIQAFPVAADARAALADRAYRFDQPSN